MIQSKEIVFALLMLMPVLAPFLIAWRRPGSLSGEAFDDFKTALGMQIAFFGLAHVLCKVAMCSANSQAWMIASLVAEGLCWASMIPTYANLFSMFRQEPAARQPSAPATHPESH